MFIAGFTITNTNRCCLLLANRQSVTPNLNGGKVSKMVRKLCGDQG